MQILDITSVYRRGSRIKWTNVEKKKTPKELPLLCLTREISDLLVCG